MKEYKLNDFCCGCRGKKLDFILKYLSHNTNITKVLHVWLSWALSATARCQDIVASHSLHSFAFHLWLHYSSTIVCYQLKYYIFRTFFVAVGVLRWLYIARNSICVAVKWCVRVCVCVSFMVTNDVGACWTAISKLSDMIHLIQRIPFLLAHLLHLLDDNNKRHISFVAFSSNEYFRANA